MVLTSSSGHPEAMICVWDCTRRSRNSLSFISARIQGRVRKILMRKVATVVSSPRISPTVVAGFSDILLMLIGFQFLMPT
jgi:hypothetical protein